MKFTTVLWWTKPRVQPVKAINERTVMLPRPVQPLDPWRNDPWMGTADTVMISACDLQKFRNR